MRIKKKINNTKWLVRKSTKPNVNEIGQLSQNQYYALKLKLILNYYNQASIDLSNTKEKCEIKSTKLNGRQIAVYFRKSEDT